MSNLSTNFQVFYQPIPSSNSSGKLLIEGLKLPKTSNFSVLAKIWKSSSKFIAASHNIEVMGVFREKRTKEGYECIFSLKNTPTELSDNSDREDFLREQIWQFGRILRIFLSSKNFAKYCDYLANNGKPSPLVCNSMLEDFLKETGVIA